MAVYSARPTTGDPLSTYVESRRKQIKWIEEEIASDPNHVTNVYLSVEANRLIKEIEEYLSTNS